MSSKNVSLPTATMERPEATVSKDTLTITDNRTGKTYTIPITHSTIRAMDFRQIKVEPDEFGMMTYDPAFTNTASCQSKVTLIDPERSVNRDVLIYMNHPLRYRGETFYQAGFQPDDSATILQVVHNPSFLAPYVACVIVAAGLLVQFGFHLVGFSRQRRSAIA